MHICICTSVGSSGGNFDGHNITEEVGLLQRLQVILGYNYVPVYPNTLRCASRDHIIAERSEATNLDDGSPILS